jgi:CRP-like cAMP-binding protein
MPDSYLPFLHAYIQQLSPLPTAAWEAFSTLFSTNLLYKHDYFARAGKVENTIGFLIKGTVRAFFRDKQGTEYNKTFHIPYGFIGAYSSVTSQQLNQICIQALEDCTLLTADYRKVVELYDTFPALERFARILAENYFILKEKREIELVLLEAGERYRIFQKEFPGLESRIPQYHIASYLGITPTQLSRIRAKKA